MNNFKNIKNLDDILRIAVVVAILALISVGYTLWIHYLDSHFVGTFDVDGLPSTFFRTGWPLMLDAWELWLVPSIFILVIAELSRYAYQCFYKKPSQATAISSPQPTTHPHIEIQQNSLDFEHSLEIETLKQQNVIIKAKYFEEHKRAEQAIREKEEVLFKLESMSKEMPQQTAPIFMQAPPAPSTAHFEAEISSLKAENKKLLKQMTGLQDDLEQSNALIEKLLEVQSDDSNANG